MELVLVPHTEALSAWVAHMVALSTPQAARCSFEGLAQQQLSLFLGSVSNSHSNDKGVIAVGCPSWSKCPTINPFVIAMQIAQNTSETTFAAVALASATSTAELLD